MCQLWLTSLFGWTEIRFKCVCVYIYIYIYKVSYRRGDVHASGEPPVIAALQCEIQINIVYPSVTVSDFLYVLDNMCKIQISEYTCRVVVFLGGGGGSFAPPP